MKNHSFVFQVTSFMTFLLVTVSLWSARAQTLPTGIGKSPKVDADLRLYDETVAKMKADFSQTPAEPHDKEWVKKKLQHMVDVDQYMRRQTNLPFTHSYSQDEKDYFWQEFHPRFKNIDTANTNDLKDLLKIYPWFVISEFGEIADNNAWILAQHADEDPHFQKDVLEILSDLYQSGETSPKNYAYLFDRVAASFSNLSQRTLQRYGTQGSCTSPGIWEPLPMEDPVNVDQRRATVGLGTMAEYKARFKDICH